MATSKNTKKDQIRSNVNKGVTKAGEKKSGVIQTILSSIKKKEQTQDSLLKILTKNFPDRDQDGLKKTIKAQIGTTTRPTRMEKERGVQFKIETREIKGHPKTFYSFVGEIEWSEEETESEE